MTTARSKNAALATTDANRRLLAAKARNRLAFFAGEVNDLMEQTFAPLMRVSGFGLSEATPSDLAGRANAGGVCTHSLRLASPKSSILGNLTVETKRAPRRPRAIETHTPPSTTTHAANVR